MAAKKKTTAKKPAAQPKDVVEEKPEPVVEVSSAAPEPVVALDPIPEPAPAPTPEPVLQPPVTDDEGYNKMAPPNLPPSPSRPIHIKCMACCYKFTELSMQKECPSCGSTSLRVR